MLCIHLSITHTHTCTLVSRLSLGSHCPRDHLSSSVDTPALPCRDPALGGEEPARRVTLGDVGFREVGHTGPPQHTPGQRTNWGERNGAGGVRQTQMCLEKEECVYK